MEGEGDTGGGGRGTGGGRGHWGGRGALTGPPTQTHTGRKKQSDTRLHLLHHPPTNYVVLLPSSGFSLAWMVANMCLFIPDVGCGRSYDASHPTREAYLMFFFSQAIVILVQVFFINKRRKKLRVSVNQWTKRMLSSRHLETEAKNTRYKKALKLLVIGSVCIKIGSCIRGGIWRNETVLVLE